MNLPGKPRTEEEQNYEHQYNLVRGMRDKGFDYEQILDLADVDELDLDEETVRYVLGIEGVGKEALSEMVSQTYGIGKYFANSMYIPFSSFIDRDEKADKGDATPFHGTFSSWVFGNSLVGGITYGITGDENMVLGYVLTTLGINAVDGLYNIYKHKRDRIAKERMSELEQITNGEDDSEESLE